jgi:hypothetical protein
LQDGALNRLFGTSTLNKLINAEVANGNAAYKMSDLFSDLKKGIWSELPARKPIDIYRRNLQKSYVNILNNIVNPSSAPASVPGIGGITITVSSSTDKSDIRSFVRAHLSALRNEILAAAAGTADTMSKYHLQDVAKRIDDALNPKN